MIVIFIAFLLFLHQFYSSNYGCECVLFIAYQKPLLLYSFNYIMRYVVVMRYYLISYKNKRKKHQCDGDVEEKMKIKPFRGMFFFVLIQSKLHRENVRFIELVLLSCGVVDGADDFFFLRYYPHKSIFIYGLAEPLFIHAIRLTIRDNFSIFRVLMQRRCR